MPKNTSPVREAQEQKLAALRQALIDGENSGESPPVPI